MVKIQNSGLVLGSSKFPLPQLPQKMTLTLKGVKIGLKNNHLALLVQICDTLCRTEQSFDLYLLNLRNYLSNQRILSVAGIAG